MNGTQASLPYDKLVSILQGVSDPWLVVWPGILIGLFIVAVGAMLVWRRWRERVELEPEYRNADLPGTGEIRPIDDESETTVESAPVPVEDLVGEVRGVDQSAWMKRLSTGLARTRDGLRGSLSAIFSGRVSLDAGTLDRVHECLYRADVGVKTADALIEGLRGDSALKAGCDWENLKMSLGRQVESILAKVEKPFEIPTEKPMVILVIGVNGVGKTTTIGKLGAHFLARGMVPMLCAADTFRAAAIDQLQVWADRLGVQIVRHQPGADPAAVAFDGVKAARSRGADVLLIDTAGRLHNKEELMAQLDKIKRVVSRDLPGAPHETWLVLDATTGQNAVAQVKAFREVANVTGLVVTKLDGTAKGGVLIGIADQFGIPVRHVGVGERVADLHEFKASDYAKSLFE